ncbi:MAG TPA: methyltransferase domain-containing protein [Thermoplasmata archaeon]|jgi:SAM-dependent methyltransferase
MPLLSGASRAKRFFDGLAPVYDRINARIYQRAWLEDVRQELRGRVLDVGVGTGFTTDHLPDAVGIDLSTEMLRLAKVPGRLLRGDFRRPPFRRSTFDTVVFAGSFYYLDDPVGGMRTAEELLRPHGRVVILAPASKLFAAAVPVYRRGDYERFLAAAGLGLDAYERLGWAACLVTGSKP